MRYIILYHQRELDPLQVARLHDYVNDLLQFISHVTTIVLYLKPACLYVEQVNHVLYEEPHHLSLAICDPQMFLHITVDRRFRDQVCHDGADYIYRGVHFVGDCGRQKLEK